MPKDWFRILLTRIIPALIIIMLSGLILRGSHIFIEATCLPRIKVFKISRGIRKDRVVFTRITTLQNINLFRTRYKVWSYTKRNYYQTGIDTNLQSRITSQNYLSYGK